ncbi:hypothetical protein [Aeromicrobium chenweiae]|uniref:Uncharacterized protein n=1 Tax=Aeromicrobium chenweiae TaxID=2079793 RepID=A0A2S0WPR3_9ACTN|nr:hypothetical protein [Aeromicrobium chenweiae]AWB93291.1 hypothetical protein C3E78_14340 [Aeromicrobium chenweiae]TGN34284.1 hypothetical protein E4L97_04375 [Aeromicrobium chenweiae]
MARNRIVVGSFGADTRLAAIAHRLRDEGHEVVLVGGGQSAEQLARTAVAEDASRLVVDGDDSDLERLRALCAELGVAAPELGTGSDEMATGCDAANARER